MKPSPRFTNLPNSFWACVRHIGQKAGYTARGKNTVLAPTADDIARSMAGDGLDPRHVVGEDATLTKLGTLLQEYLAYRADILNSFVEPHLMNARRAKTEYARLKAQLRPHCPIPMNKQKGAKKAPAYLTAIVNMLIEANSGRCLCDYDPKNLTTVIRNGLPLRTLARRVDGAFPSAVNPIAVWEIKEYYYTTTFGSRVADGIYETLLDGMELAELQEKEGIRVLHYLFVDAHYTWWECGRSYLCRILDTLHMGYIDEVLFGAEVFERLPQIVKEWAAIAGSRKLIPDKRIRKPPR